MDFRGASADSVAALIAELRTAVSGSAAAAAAEALFAASVTFRAEGGLRRFATDVAVPAEAKTGLVAEVFSSSFDPAAVQVVASAVTRRWTHGGDLPDALERLAEVAVVLSAEEAATQVGDELFGLGRVIGGSPALREALSDPNRTVDDKARLLADLLDGKALPATVALARQALAGSYGTVESAVASYRSLASAVQGEGVATVTVAKPLTGEQSSRLTSALTLLYGRPIHANVVTDPAVLGGIKVEIGDDVIDGSIASKLDLATRQLVG